MRRLHPILLAAALAAGCTSDAEKLVELRTDLRTRLDELYSAYGRSARGAGAGAGEPAQADEEPATASRLLGELDRSYFEGFCLARGRGERPLALSGKLDAFVKEPANERACRDAAKLEARIADLEARIAELEAKPRR